MAQKKTNQLGLAPLPANGSGGVPLYSTMAHPGGPINKNEQRIVVETQKQIHVIRHQRLKEEAAAQEIGQMHRQSAQEFVEVARHLSKLNATARGKDYQRLVEEFTERSAQMAAQHLCGVLEVSSRNIGMETARPVYQEEPETQKKQPPIIQVVPRRGLWQRIFGD